MPASVGVLVGLLAALAGLAVGELVAGLSDSLRSPVVSVGDRVVDNVPKPVKTWAIDTFGTNDKAVLLGGVAVLLAAFAALVGVLALRRSLRAGLAGVGVFTLVGVAASLGRGGGGWTAPLPSLAAGAAAAAVLVVLARLATEAWASGPVDPDDDRAVSTQRMQTASRRRFLGTAAAVGAGAVVVGGVGRWLAQQAAVAGSGSASCSPGPRTRCPRFRRGRRWTWPASHPS